MRGLKLPLDGRDFTHLSFDLGYLFLEARNTLGENHRWISVSSIKFGKVSADTLLELLHPHLELVLVEVLVAVVDALELASVHGDDAVGK
ncbi:hypothetical protein D3C71_1353070 [compost metagenome]